MKNEDKNAKGTIGENKNPEMQDSVTNVDNLNPAEIDSLEYRQSIQGKSQGMEKNHTTWPQDETLEEYLEKEKGSSPMKPGSLDRE